MKALLTLVLATVIFGCQQPKPDLAMEMQALQKAAEDYQANVGPETMDAVKSFYTADARMIPPGEPVVQGAEAIAVYADAFKSLKNFKSAFGTPEVFLDAGGDTGYSISEATLSFDGDDGKTVSESFRDVHFWMKQADGSWKIVIDIWNSPVPDTTAAK